MFNRSYSHKLKYVEMISFVEFHIFGDLLLVNYFALLLLFSLFPILLQNMVRVSKRQKFPKRGQSSKEDNDRSNEQNEDPDCTDLKDITDNCHEPKSSENIIIEQKLELALNKIRDMTNDIRFLLNEVVSLKEDVNSIKTQLKGKSTEIVSSPSAVSSSIHPPISPSTRPDNLTKLPSGPFPKYEAISRVVPRPSSKDIVNTIGGKAHSLQFTCNLYVDLIEKVLGPAKDSNLDYRAMVKEAILVTKAVVSNIKEQYNIDPDLRWSHIDPTIKLEAYKKLEEATEHLLPLKVCSEFWGAHVLISNFWLKRKKSAKKPPSKRKNEPTSKDNSLQEFDELGENTPSADNPIRNNNPQKKLKAFSIPCLTHP